MYCSCIEKWLKSAGKSAKCPECNHRAKRADIRVIYVKNLSAVDTTERDRALRDLEEEKQLRIQAKRDEAQALLQQNLARGECDRLKEELRVLREKCESAMPSVPSAGPSEEGEILAIKSDKERSYVLLKNFSISKVGLMSSGAMQKCLMVWSFVG